MKKILVVYKSTYGHTKTYAQWISDQLRCEMVDIASCQESELKHYDIIVYGGGIYAGAIDGITFLNRNLEHLPTQTIVVFTVGLAPTFDSSIFAPMLDRCFSKSNQERIQFFHFQGGIDYAKLSFVHKNLMRILKVTVKNDTQRSIEEEVMLDTFGSQVNYCDSANIAALVDWIRHTQKKLQFD